MSSRNLDLIIVCFVTISLISGCVGNIAPQFPDADIVYQTGFFDNPSIGFVDSDGTNNTFISTSTYLIKPIWSTDGDTLYGIARRESVVDGYPSMWREGKRLKSCKQWWATEVIGGIIETEDSTEILITGRNQILLVDLDRCEELHTYVDYFNTGLYLFGLSLSPDHKRFAYGVAEHYYSDTKAPEYSIMIQEMSGGEPVNIGLGINPVWSPDGQQISYLKLDGIYVMKFDGSNSRLVTKFDVSSGYKDGKFNILAPYPRWSPDGDWLIFHRCHPECTRIDDYTIVKVEVATGMEVIIKRGGAYPYWR